MFEIFSVDGDNEKWPTNSKIVFSTPTTIQELLVSINSIRRNNVDNYDFYVICNDETITPVSRDAELSPRTRSSAFIRLLSLEPITAIGFREKKTWLWASVVSQIIEQSLSRYQQKKPAFQSDSSGGYTSYSSQSYRFIYIFVTPGWLQAQLTNPRLLDCEDTARRLLKSQNMIALPKKLSKDEHIQIKSDHLQDFITREFPDLAPTLLMARPPSFLQFVGERK